MPDQHRFTDFIRRIRAGDELAATELVRQYEPVIRREVRLRLEHQHLGRLLDSVDVCQSVLASFFVRVAAGQYDLEQPEQLIKLLVTMARNKLASAARHEHRQRRDQRRVIGTAPDLLAEVVDTAPSPSQVVAGKELFERFRRALSVEERRLADLRADGRSWAEIAAQLGGTPQARRMQLARAVERVTRALGLSEDDA